MVPRLEAALLAAAVVLTADHVPTFDVESFCRKVATMAEAPADVDVCVRKEQDAREQLVRAWVQFPPPDRSYCARLSRIGGDPTYSALLTCLELQEYARSLQEKGEETFRQRGPALRRPR
jgi:hypothetical protein